MHSPYFILLLPLPTTPSFFPHSLLLPPHHIYLFSTSAPNPLSLSPLHLYYLHPRIFKSFPLTLHPSHRTPFTLMHSPLLPLAYGVVNSTRLATPSISPLLNTCRLQRCPRSSPTPLSKYTNARMHERTLLHLPPYSFSPSPYLPEATLSF